MYSSPTTYYSDDAVLGIGSLLADAAGGPLAADGWYSTGSTWWQTSGGTIVATGSC